MLSVNLTAQHHRGLRQELGRDREGRHGRASLSTTVKATDNSGIIAVAGAVGRLDGRQRDRRRASATTSIDNDVLAYLDDVSLTTDGSLTLEATSDGEIGGVAVGVAVSIGAADGKLAGAGSILINQITNTVEAYVADTVTGTGSRGHAAPP